MFCLLVQDDGAGGEGEYQGEFDEGQGGGQYTQYGEHDGLEQAQYEEHEYAEAEHKARGGGQ